MVKFDIDGVISGRPTLDRRLTIEAMKARRRRRSTAGARDTVPHDFGRQPVYAQDEIPDFEVVILLEKQRGNRWEARLRWYLFGQMGDFPVIPADALTERTARKPTMEPHAFYQERLAVIEAAHQASALTDQFIQWATDQGE